MAKSDLGRKTTQIDTSLDGIVVVNCLGDIPGGATLDVTGVDANATTINAGHVIIKTADGEYKPLGVHAASEAVAAQGTEGSEGYVPAVPAQEAGYDSLPSGASYVGILKATVLVNDPRAAILTIGQVNAAAAAKAVGVPYTSDIKSALGRIEFLYS